MKNKWRISERIILIYCQFHQAFCKFILSLELLCLTCTNTKKKDDINVAIPLASMQNDTKIYCFYYWFSNDEIMREN